MKNTSLKKSFFTSKLSFSWAMVQTGRQCEAPVHLSRAGTSDGWNRGFTRVALKGVSMPDLLVFILGFLGLLSMLKGWQSDATVSGEGPSYDRPSYAIPGYHDDGQTRQSRRREREKHRRAADSRSVCVPYPPLHAHLPHGIL